MMDSFGHGWEMASWWFLGILILALAVWIIVRITRRATNGRDKSPLDILKERYAKGEISKEEFEERKKDLMQ